MVEIVLLVVFALALIACALFNLPLVGALLAALIMFSAYGLARGHSFTALARASWTGIRTAGPILIALLCIGILTATWRACGTIACIVWECITIVPPSIMLLGTFLLCCLVSVLTGTSFGTASTMGVICASVALAQGLPDILVGGAVLAGCYFGDRCSPLSTSALLVGQVTGTKVMDNIPDMVRSAAVPFALSCLLFLLLGFVFQPISNAAGLASVERAVSGFVFSWWVIVPVVVALGLALLRVDIRIALLSSAVVAGVIAVALQGLSPDELLRATILGFTPADGTSLFAGGGIASMIDSVLIVMISSCFAGIFSLTGFLSNITAWMSRVAKKSNAFVAYLVASGITSAIACNQTLAIMLTEQLCADIALDAHNRAINLENTVVVMAALVPWSIAGAVPLASAGTSLAGMSTAFFLYLLPLSALAASFICGKKVRSASKED